jgi:DNA-binding transcriptional MerR regulator
VPGKHRRYNSDDVARLEIMRRLVMDGVMPAEAARVAQQTDLATAQPKRTELRLVADLAETAGVLDLDSPKNAGRGLARAASMLDAGACQTIIARLLEKNGVLWTWDKVLVPVLITFGERWATTGDGIEIEHMLSEVVIAELQSLALSIDQPVNARPVILAAAPHELHTLPLYAISAALAEHQISSRVLGARLPTEALAAACRKLGPSSVVIWSQSQGTADLEIWRAIAPQRPAPLKIAVGPGWGVDLPGDVLASTSLAETLIALAQSSGH